MWVREDKQEKPEAWDSSFKRVRWEDKEKNIGSFLKDLYNFRQESLQVRICALLLSIEDLIYENSLFVIVREKS